MAALRYTLHRYQGYMFDLREPAIRSRYARLTVLVPPEPPKILQGSFYSTTEDRNIRLECVSIGGKPPAETFTCQAQNTADRAYRAASIQIEVSAATSTLINMTPKEEHHKQTFTCQAQNTADRAYRAASIQIEVSAATSTLINMTPKEEHHKQTFTCQAQNTADRAYRAASIQIEVSAATSTLINMTPKEEHHKQTFTCQAQNTADRAYRAASIQIEAEL
ncbi:Uncharacterized protein OBRU01_19036 [Operophtera brumata]|uniref:CD80-like immunoglobulin C2-set domain-containing protein n=1 Tax=Operophtera brumata TaxID=104452 RepID=A0A0L7KXH4_OPEBR|nr:Uncharacterized protein OBRU01_19036 [Operophtera brumata]